MEKETEFEKIIRAHKSTIYTVCYMFSDSNEEVADMFQEALLNLWKSFGTFKGRCSHVTWIWRVTLNTCISYERKRRKRPALISLNPDINLYEEESSGQADMLHRRIGKLGLFDRAIVLLWLEDLTYEEIGEIVGISAKNVSVRLVRIREQLKKMKTDE